MFKISNTLQIHPREFFWSFARSSGKGGQNVNKVNSKAVLQFNITESQSLPADVKERFKFRYPNRVDKLGFITLTSERHRDQQKNVQDCLEKLKNLIGTVAIPPKKRKTTRPTLAARKKRMELKKKQSQKKHSRQSKSWLEQ